MKRYPKNYHDNLQLIVEVRVEFARSNDHMDDNETCDMEVDVKKDLTFPILSLRHLEHQLMELAFKKP